MSIPKKTIALGSILCILFVFACAPNNSGSSNDKNKADLDNAVSGGEARNETGVEETVNIPSDIDVIENTVSEENIIEITNELLQDSKIKMILDSPKNEYEILDNIHANKDYPDVLVKYPQITGLEDKEIEDRINQMILEKVDLDFVDNIYEEMGDLIDYLGQLGLSYHNQQTYDITLARDNFLCIQWCSSYDGGAHPSGWLETVMIEMTTGRTVSFMEFCELPKEAFDVLYDAQMWNYCGDKGRPYDDALIQNLYENNIRWDCACFYEDHFQIVLSTAQVYGHIRGHWIFDFDYEILNGYWKNETDETFPKQEPEPYIKPALVSPEEFDFGNYFWFVDAGSLWHMNALPEYKYAIIGKGTNNISDGIRIFEKIQNKYYKKYDIPKSTYDGSLSDRIETMDKIISERQVLGISADGKRVLCLSYQYREGQRDYYEYWDELYEIYENDTLIESVLFEKKHYDDFLSNLFTATSHMNGYFITTLERDSETTYINFENGIESNSIKTSHAGNFDKTTYLSETYKQSDYRIYSLENGSLINEYTLKENREIICYIGNKILLTEKDNYSEGKVYLADPDGSNEIYLGSYMFNPVLSPDGKYLAYESKYYGNEIDSGYYIKNLETGDTVYYECDIMYKNIKGFIEKDGFYELIEQIEGKFIQS